MDSKRNLRLKPKTIVEDLREILPTLRERKSEDAISLYNSKNSYSGTFRQHSGYIKDRPHDLNNVYLSVLQKLEQKTFPSSLNSKNVLLTQGTSSALEQIFKAYFKLDVDEIVLTPPYRGLYPVIATINNIQIQTLPKALGMTGLHIRAIVISEAIIDRISELQCTS